MQSTRPFGFWLTTLLGAAILIVWNIVQAGILGVYTYIMRGTRDPLEFVDRLQSNAADGDVLALLTILSTPVALGMVALVTSWRAGLTSREYLGLRPAPVADFARWLALAVLVAALTDLGKWLLGLPLQTEFMVATLRSTSVLPALILAIAVCAPLWEEVLFRGFFQAGYLGSPVGAVGALLVPALLWAAIHTQYGAYDIASIFVLGLVLGLARLRTDSLYVPIAMHMTLNLLAFGSTRLYEWLGV